MKPNIRLIVLLLLGGAILLLRGPRHGLMATECSTDAQCSAPDGACNLTSSTCVQCVQNGDRAQTSSDCCSGYTDPNTNLCANQTTCYGCGNDQDCSTCSEYPVCNLSTGDCSSCVPDGSQAQSASDCCSGTFDPATGLCATCNNCSRESDCSTTCGLHCDLSIEACVSCVPSGDITSDPTCDACCSNFCDFDNGYYCE